MVLIVIKQENHAWHNELQYKGLIDYTVISVLNFPHFQVSFKHKTLSLMNYVLYQIVGKASHRYNFGISYNLINLRKPNTKIQLLHTKNML